MSYEPMYEGPLKAECETIMNNVLETKGQDSEVPCNCGPPQTAVVITNWNGEDRGRRELICGMPEDLGGCGFHSWVDQHICPRGRIVIATLLQALEGMAVSCVSMTKYNQTLEAEIDKFGESLRDFIKEENQG